MDRELGLLTNHIPRNSIELIHPQNPLDLGLFDIVNIIFGDYQITFLGPVALVDLLDLVREDYFGYSN